ncbi:MAG: FitA-like ribbon-helix-helix domain-containing protein, partial [Stellaceae bacterium]
MAQILIRNIDDVVIEALRRRATACGTSMEEQARRMLI